MECREKRVRPWCGGMVGAMVGAMVGGERRVEPGGGEKVLSMR